MIAKYNGRCSKTGEKIIAGVTEIVRTADGKWKIAESKSDYLKRCGYANVEFHPNAAVVVAYSDVFQNRWGDETLKHFVVVEDADGIEMHTPTRCYEAEGALKVAEDTAAAFAERGIVLEVIIDDLIRQ